MKYKHNNPLNNISLENKEYIASLIDKSKSNGFSSGFTEGKTEGRNEAFILVARNMLESGYNEDEVYRLTGLHFTDIID